MASRILSILFVVLLIVSISNTLYGRQNITAKLKAYPSSYSGSCPAKIVFRGFIQTTKPVKVQYRFIRSDGAINLIHTLNFDKPGRKSVSTTWTLGGPEQTRHEGWEAIEILYPQEVESNRAHFKIRCTEEKDLSVNIINCPRVVRPNQELKAGFKVLGKSTFSTALNNIAVDIILASKSRYPSPAPYAVYSPNFSDGVLLKGGREHISFRRAGTVYVKLNGANTIPSDTPPGSYYLGAVIDAGNKVRESDERNNVSFCRIRVVKGAAARPVKEDCISFNPGSAEVRKIKGSWKIVDGRRWMFDFGSQKRESIRALKIIKHYRMNQSCFVGRPDPSFQYLLVNGRPPAGGFTGEDCISFNPGSAEVRKIKGRWKIVDGRHWMFDFGSNESEARQSLAIIKKYGFRYSCFVGRPNPSFEYLRR